MSGIFMSPLELTIFAVIFRMKYGVTLYKVTGQDAKDFWKTCWE